MRILCYSCHLQVFIKKLFKVILSANNGAASVPMCIKHVSCRLSNITWWLALLQMFDFLDEQAMEHLIDDPEVTSSHHHDYR